MTIAKRGWVPEVCETRMQGIARGLAEQASADILGRIEFLAEDNKRIHERECFNLNPATNVMNPKAEALLA